MKNKRNKNRREGNRMDRDILEKVNEEVEKILESYHDETIKTEHNFNVLKRKILRERYGISEEPKE